MRLRKTAEQRKAEIVTATLRLAFELGPDAITTERIARKVGVSQPAVFRHFPKKEDIWTAVIGWIGERLAQRWGKVRAGSDDPLDQLYAILRTQLELIQRTPAIPAILFSRELHVRNRTLRTAVKTLMERFHRLLREVLDNGVHAGALRADLDTADAAFVIIALVQGLAVRWSVSERRFDLVEEGERLLAVVLQGFTAMEAIKDVTRS
jgi:AcrR family transcriptional regulator